MIDIEEFVADFSREINQEDKQPWELILNIATFIKDKIKYLNSDDYAINNDIAIHKTAFIDSNVIMKSPIIIGKDCFVGANSYLRNGVFLTEKVKIGTGCEIKSSMIFDKSAVAHFNFIGDSIIGKNVNFEAGAITANHYNERRNKTILVAYQEKNIDTHVIKFGSLVGDFSKIGANAVLSPGTILNKRTVVKRLELIEQVKNKI